MSEHTTNYKHMTGTIVPKKNGAIEYKTSKKGDPQANFLLQTFNGNLVGVTIYNKQVAKLKPFLKENAIVKLEANLRQNTKEGVTYNNVTIDDNNHSTIEVYIDAVSTIEAVREIIKEELMSKKELLDSIGAEPVEEETKEVSNGSVF